MFVLLCGFNFGLTKHFLVFVSRKKKLNHQFQYNTWWIKHWKGP